MAARRPQTSPGSYAGCMTDPLDFLAVDGLLDPTSARSATPCATSRSGARAPRRRVVRRGHAARRPRPAARQARPARDAPRGLRLRRHQRDGVRRGLPRARGGRLRAAQLRVSVQGSLAMFAIHRWGSEEHKEEWLPRMATGEAIGCFGLTESDAGSDPGSMKTRASRDGDDWVLNGSKMWITNGTLADVAVVWAQTDDGIRGFVVPTDTKGFSAHKIQRKLSLRASVTAELAFDDLRLPGRRGVPRGARAQGSAVVPQRGALRHRLGRGRRGPRLPRGGAGLHAASASSSASRWRRSSSPRRSSREMVIAVNNASLVAVADRRAQGRRHADAGPGVLRQVRQRAGRRSTSRARRGRCSAAPASPWTTRSCGT